MNESGDAAFVWACMGFSGSTECLILGFDRDKAYVLFWDFFAEDYQHRWVSLADLTWRNK